jgi:hypothetical protein
MKLNASNSVKPHMERLILVGKKFAAGFLCYFFFSGDEKKKNNLTTIV